MKNKLGAMIAATCALFISTIALFLTVDIFKHVITIIYLAISVVVLIVLIIKIIKTLYNLHNK